MSPRFPSAVVSVLLAVAACGGRADEVQPLPPGGGGGGPEPTDPGEARGAPAAPPSASGAPSSVEKPLAPSNASVPFHLVVSNQSFAVALADIDVYVDGTHVVTGDFPVGSQHSFFTFDFPVRGGKHELKAVTKKGNVSFQGAFDVPEERWGILMFWTSETPTFSFDVQATQPMFD
jgi:hypothetical protein